MTTNESIKIIEDFNERERVDNKADLLYRVSVRPVFGNALPHKLEIRREYVRYGFQSGEKVGGVFVKTASYLSGHIVTYMSTLTRNFDEKHLMKIEMKLIEKFLQEAEKSKNIVEKQRIKVNKIAISRIATYTSAIGMLSNMQRGAKIEQLTKHENEESD